jgi:MFS family permease
MDSIAFPPRVAGLGGRLGRIIRAGAPTRGVTLAAFSRKQVLITNSSRTAPAGARLLALVFLPFAAGYYCSFLFRNVNSVVFPELTQAFGLSPGMLGLLTSAYFITFAGAQVPLGMLMDRYGPRRVNAALLLVASAGATVFAQASGLPALLLGRALMGLGVAVCLMSAMTAFVIWFPRERTATLFGWMLLVGACGALSATKPIEMALRVMDWRTLFVVFSALAAAASLAIFLFVPEKPAPNTRATLREQFAVMGVIFRSRGFWSIACAAALVQGVAIGLLGLWAGPWMRDVAGLDRAGMADNLLMAAGAFGVGGVVCGALSDRLAQRGVSPIVTFFAGCVACTAAMLPITMGYSTGAAFFWTMYLGFSAFGSMSYPLLATRFPTEIIGRVVTALNLVTFSLAFVAQFGVGAIISLWPVTDGRYAIDAYRASFALCWALQVVAVAWLWYVERGEMRRGVQSTNS